MAQQYENGEFELPSLKEYVQTVCDQLEILPKDTVIARVTGDGAPDTLVAPLWSRKKFVVMNEIDKELVRRNSMQGTKFFLQN
jgi:radical SAM superfamily enzyme